MRKTFIIEIEQNKNALSRKKYCPNCGGHVYNIAHQLEPKEIEDWWVECALCFYEGPGAPARDLAIARWEQINEM